MDVKVIPGSFAQLPAALALAPGYTVRRLTMTMHAVVQRLQGGVVERTPAAHGTLRQSVFGEVQAFPDGLGVEGVVGAGAGYAPYVELGTRPHMPPLAPLVDWVEVKLGLRGKEALRAARAIRWSIFQRGTLAIGMFHLTLRDQLPEIEASFDRAMIDINAHLLDGDAAGG